MERKSNAKQKKPVLLTPASLVLRRKKPINARELSLVFATAYSRRYLMTKTELLVLIDRFRPFSGLSWKIMVDYGENHNRHNCHNFLFIQALVQGVCDYFRPKAGRIQPSSATDHPSVFRNF